jgi:hypothetical protein
MSTFWFGSKLSASGCRTWAAGVSKQNNQLKVKIYIESSLRVHCLTLSGPAFSREEQDLLEILDLELISVKTLVSILIEPSIATVVLLDSCLLRIKNWPSWLILACKEMGISNLAWFLLQDILTIELLIEHILIGLIVLKSETWFKRLFKPNIYLNINVAFGAECVFCSPWQLNLITLSFSNLARDWDFLL